MSFGNPLLLLTLLVLPVAVGLYVFLERRPVRYAMTFTNLDVLAGVSGDRPIRRYVAPALLLLAIASLCVALGRPHRTTLVPSERATVVVVIDVSGSMHATDVKPSRLAAAQAAARKFLEEVPRQVRIALIAFSSEAQVGAPPTTDRDLVRQAIDSLDSRTGGGTAIGDALAAAVQLIKPQSTGRAHTIAYTVAAAKSPASILFLSDGKQTRGNLLPLAGAARAKAAGIPVYTIALGTPNGVLGPGQLGFSTVEPIPVPPDPATLRRIAQVTGGKFFEARTARALRSAYTNLGSRLGREPGQKEVTYEFVILGAGLLLAAGLFSALWAPRLP